MSYHSQQDTFLAPYNEKVELFELLKKFKFDATLHLIKDESEIDGRLIRNLKHDGISNERVFKKELPAILEKLKDRSFKRGKKLISYPCDDKIYTFKDTKDKYELKITPF